MKGPKLAIVGSCVGCEHLATDCEDAPSHVCTHDRSPDPVSARSMAPGSSTPSWCPELHAATVEHARAVLAKDGEARWFSIPERQRLARVGQIEDQLADVRHELSAEDIEAAEALIDLAKGCDRG